MDGKDEKPPLAVRPGDRGRLARHRRPCGAAFRVDVAVVCRDDLHVGILHGNRRHRHGSFGVADFVAPPLDSRELLGAAVERDRKIRLSAADAELERNHVEHVRMSLRRLHEKAASRARPDIPAAVFDKRLDLLAAFRAERFRLVHGRAPRHHENVSRVEGALPHRVAVHGRRDDAFRARRQFDPAVRADAARAVVDEYGHLERGFCETSKCGRSRCEYQYCLFHSQYRLYNLEPHDIISNLNVSRLLDCVQQKRHLELHNIISKNGGGRGGRARCPTAPRRRGDTPPRRPTANR